MELYNNLVIFCIFFLIRSAKTQECERILDELTHCLSSGPLTITCPVNHLLRIVATDYYRSESAICPSPSVAGTECKVKNSVDELSNLGLIQETFTTSIAYQTSNACPNPGTDFIYVQYKCDPAHNSAPNAKALSLSNTDPAWTGSMIHIDSHMTGLLGTQIYESSTGCEVVIDPNIEARVSMIFMTRNNNCDQKVVVWDDNRSKDFCGTNDIMQLPCSSDGYFLRVKYVTTDTSVGVIFVLKVESAHELNGLTVRCGKAVDQLGITTTTQAVTTTTTTPTTTTTTTTTTTPTTTTTTTKPTTTTTTTTTTPTTTTTTPTTTTTTTTASITTAVSGDSGSIVSTHSSHLDWKTPVIVGCIIIAIILLLIVILCVLIRLRSDMNHGLTEEMETASYMQGEDNNPYKYVTELYVDGENKSKLVLPPAQRAQMGMGMKI